MNIELLNQIYLNKVLVLKGDFKEGFKNSTSVYEFMKNSNDIKRGSLKAFLLLFFDGVIALFVAKLVE